MATFTGEEKLDLLLKKVAFGVTKTGTSQATGPDGEPLTSFTAVRPEHVFKDATTSNIPTTPTTTTTSLVGVYKKDGTGSAGTNGEVQAPLAASAIASSANMPGFASGSGFKRAWDTGVNNWLGPAFGSDYAVKVYVGNSGWNGLASSMGSSNVVEVIFGADPNADWFFDYEAGVLYWTNEEASDDGSTTFDNSTNFVNTGVTSSAGTKITLGDIVYIQGYAYKGGVGVGADSSATVNISESDTNADQFLVFTTGTGSGKTLSIDTDGDGSGTGDFALKYNPFTNVLTLGAAIHSASLTTSAFSLGGANVLSTAAEINLLDDAAAGSIVNNTAVIYGSSGEVNATTFELAGTELAFTRGIADDNLLEVDGTPVSGDFAQFTDNGLVSRTAGQVLSDISALSTSGTAAKATAIAGGVLGSVPYQSGAGATAFLAGNTAATNLFMRSVGDGSAAAAPTFAAVTKADVGLGSVDNDSTATILASAATAAATAGDAAYVALAGGSTIAGANPLIFEGASPDGFETTLAVVDPDADRTITLPNATGTVALTANKLSDFAATTSSELASTISDETGTGALVFAGSPTLTGTISAAAASFSGDVTVSGNLNVIGSGTYINLQQENVYMKDALITVGYVDGTDDDDFTNGSAAASDVGIEAYKQGVSSSSPSLVYAITPNYWAIDNKDHAASALTRVARTFKVAHTITTAQINAGFFTVTHNLNHEDLIVQVRDNSTDQEVIFFKYKTKSAQTIEIYVGANFSNDDIVNVVVVG